LLARGASVGRYLVLSLIGQGGMGAVYAAYDPEVDRQVALKMLSTARGAGKARERFMREARALGKLSHPNVVQIYDVGDHDGDVFVAMELVAGQVLDVWCKGPPARPWQDVVAAYHDAARGLAAAHAKGIVHRDVKPANILRGDDGRVRVVDFGLAASAVADADRTTADGPVEAPGATAEELASSPARHRFGSTTDEDVGSLAATLPAASGSGAERTGRLTVAGALVGTPLYMAPEQFEGAAVGPAADQHSLCTALYEALFGELPFDSIVGPTTVLQLVARKTSGPRREPRQESAVPARIHDVLLRGLAPRPEDRFPSMDALADALRDAAAPRRGTGLRAAIAAGTALVLVGVGAIVAARTHALEDPCAHPERQLTGVWDADVRARVRAGLTATGRSYAGDTVSRVEKIMGDYAASWSKMRGDVCRATRSGSQRREIGELRDRCLDRRLGQIRALTEVFIQQPDVHVLDKAVESTSTLSPIAACADVEALTARVPLPEDPAVRARVASLQPGVYRLGALRAAGKAKEGVEAGRAMQAEVVKVPYAPLRAELQYDLGVLLIEAGEYPAAKETLLAAAASALEARDEHTASGAWTQLVRVVGEKQERLDEARTLVAVAPVVVRARDPRADVEWLMVQGNLMFRADKFTEAKELYERARAIRGSAATPEAIDAQLCHDLGNAIGNAGDSAGALPMFQQAIALDERVLGPDHPALAASINDMGTVLMGIGEFAQASSAFTRARGIFERALGADNVVVGYALMNEALVLFHTGDIAGAAAGAQRALAIFGKALPADHPTLTYSLALLGRSRIRMGQLDAAEASLQRARELREASVGAPPDKLVPVLLGLGELALARQRPATAVPLLERALVLHDDEFQADAQLALADALWRTGKEKARAVKLAKEARAAYEEIHHRARLEQVNRWLAEHAL
jgi:serine/threonine-protein kinase